MSTRYGGRIEITRETLKLLLGLPEDVDIAIYNDYEKDMYEVVMRSRHPVITRGTTNNF